MSMHKGQHVGSYGAFTCCAIDKMTMLRIPSPSAVPHYHPLPLGPSEVEAVLSITQNTKAIKTIKLS